MVTLGEARTVIENDESPGRFEEFCNRVVSLISGQTVLGTAVTGDLGVDGRAVQLDALTPEALVAASIRKDVATKFAEDATRIKATQSAGSVFFCATQRLSEKEKASARARVRGILGEKFAVTILTQDELAEQGIRFSYLLEEFYSAEILALRQQLADRLSKAGGATQLQIAHLLTSDEGIDNRTALADHLVCEVISRSPSTLNEVTVALQRLLRMPSTFPGPVVEAALDRMIDSKRVELRADGRFASTELGRADRDERANKTAAAEQRVQELLSREIETRLGHSLSEGDRGMLWANLMQEMSALLVRVGARFVALAEIARANGNLNDVHALASDSVRAACHATVRTIRDPRQKEETEEALFQALVEVPALAHEWLEQVIAAWLAACQLGLIPEIGHQLRPGLNRIVLALDTDIVISLLCDAEPDNAAIATLLGQWASIGGRTVIAPEVLEEVAHHAWIARLEFAEVASIIQKYPYEPGLARRIAKNAFVRSFWASRRPVRQPDFDRFIRSYSGSSPDDSTPLQATLARMLIGQRLPLPSATALDSYRHLEKRVLRVLSRTTKFAPSGPAGGTIEQDKMNRDASAIVAYATLAHSGPDTTSAVLLLTSSRRLGVAVRKGAPESQVIVAPTSTLGLLLSAVYSGQVKPQVLAQLLIAEGAKEQIGALRSELVRMLARADLLATLPQARIVSLEREVENGILDYAQKTSRSKQRVRQDILKMTDKVAALEIFSDALREAAIGAEADRIIRAQAAEIEKLSTALGNASAES